MHYERLTPLFKCDMENKLLEIVSSFYDASRDWRLWPASLMRLGEALQAKACVLVSHDYERGNGRLEQSINIEPGFAASYGSEFGAINPWLQREDRFRSPGAIWLGDQIVAERELVDSEFYRNWLHPQDLRHVLIGVLDRQGDSVVCIMLGRSESHGAFDEETVQLFRRLVPNLQRAFRSGQTFRKAQHVRNVALDVLDVLPIGVVLLSSAGNVVAANQLAKKIIETDDVFSNGSGGLGIDWGWRRLRLKDLISRPELAPGRNQPGEITSFTVPRATGSKPISVLVSPLDTGGERRSLDEPAAIMFIGDPDRPTEIDQRRLTQLYGLSRAESRVIALLAKGYRLDQCAETLGVAYETVRKHLKQVFGKTGTDRQAELVRLLVTGPAGLRL